MSDSTYSIRSTWIGGNLRSADIGSKILQMVRQLSPMGPAMSNWVLLDLRKPKWVPIDGLATATKLVERGVKRNDFSGEDEPHLGYSIIAKGSKSPSDNGTPDSINISMDLGAWSINKLEFEVGDISMPPDPVLITYPIYKGVLETLASIWPCPWALASAFMHDDSDVPEWDGVSPLEDLIRQAPEVRASFADAWIAYLSPPLARGLAPPREIASQPTPGGGAI